MNKETRQEPKLDLLEENMKKEGEQLYEQGKKKLNSFYETAKDTAEEWIDKGEKKMNEAQDCLQHSSDELIKTIKANPLTSLLVAGGVGFLLSVLLKK